MHIYEYTKLQLNEKEFRNLVFMHAPRRWKDDAENHKFLICICRSPLYKVVERLIKESGADPNNATATDVFENVLHIKATNRNRERQSWFKRQLRMSKEFDKEQMNELWIRNLTTNERKDNLNGSFYIQDGICRSTVYAMKVKLKELPYSPVNAMHATSWNLATGIFLQSLPQKAEELEADGEFQYNKKIINEYTLPVGIQINTYERE